MTKLCLSRLGGWKNCPLLFCQALSNNYQNLIILGLQVKKLCCSLRRNAKDERVLFHYNGHGVPKPTTQGEIWVFNRVCTFHFHRQTLYH